jgi:general secretion pathway protein K
MSMPHNREIQESREPEADAQGRSGERGIALLVVLWIIAGATLLVVSFNATVRSGLSFVSSEVGLSKADAVIDAGLEIAVARLIDEEEGRRWLPDGIAREISFADRRLKIRISDPNGLVDLNKADDQLLLEFFKQFTDTPSRARTIRDDIKAAREDAAKARRGADSFASKDPGADDSDPAGKALPFMDVTEARTLKGMTPDLYRRVAPFLTVYSTNGEINRLTAPEEILAASPQLRGLDLDEKRKAFLSGRGSQSSTGDQKDTNSYDQFGPAYIVEVSTGSPGEKYSARKSFVIAIGLDTGSAFHILSIKTRQPG